MARTRASDYEDKQRHILDNAAIVFARVGMEKASMAEIAREAGSSKALLYHYYDGKDALLFDIVRTHLADLDVAVAAAERPDFQPEERLRLLVKSVMDQYKDADAKHKVQLNCTDSLTNEQKEQLHDIERRIVKRFTVVLALINPELNREKPLLAPVTLSLFGVLNWIYMWFKDDGAMSREEYANLVTTLFLGGVKALR